MIAKTRAEFPFKVPMNCTQNYIFSFRVAYLITRYTYFSWKHFVKTLLWRYVMQKISWYCKFNVLFISRKIAAVSAWNFIFQISYFLCLKAFEVNLFKPLNRVIILEQFFNNSLGSKFKIIKILFNTFMFYDKKVWF